MMFNLFKKNRSGPDPYALYNAIVDQARQPAFYRDLDVDDSLDGRFDMITLHAFLVFNALSERGPMEADLSQKTFDLMFTDMDRSLRERGVGDTSVPKKVKKMGEVFYGRCDVYRKALVAGDHAALTDALHRNVYVSESEVRFADALAAYTEDASAALTKAPVEIFISGEIPWPAIKPALDDAS